jgi:UPF0271 protein
MARIDLNCDMGESHGAFVIGHDADVMPHVTSINVACGFHGGDPSVMRSTVTLAAMHAVAVGAHPGLPDLLGFGRREMAVTPQEVYDLVTYQVGALEAIAMAAGGIPLQHVKPHGALYNMAAVRDDLADAIARAVKDVDDSLVLMGLSGSALIRAGRAYGLTTASEVFADRAYMADGTLAPRSRSDAMITSVDVAVTRAVRMVTLHEVIAVDGAAVTLDAETICIHGDAPQAALFAQRIRAGLDAAGISVQSLGARSLPA